MKDMIQPVALNDAGEWDILSMGNQRYFVIKSLL
jgi:hypothetical protein